MNSNCKSKSVGEDAGDEGARFAYIFFVCLLLACSVVVFFIFCGLLGSYLGDKSDSRLDNRITAEYSHLFKDKFNVITISTDRLDEDDCLYSDIKDSECGFIHKYVGPYHYRLTFDGTKMHFTYKDDLYLDDAYKAAVNLITTTKIEIYNIKQEQAAMSARRAKINNEFKKFEG